ncbi:MAG: ATP-dependent DNA helicase RecG [Candidatus Taylorbacteria bacterium]
MQLPDLLENHFRLHDLHRVALKKLGLKTVEDILYHFPARYGDTSEMRTIDKLEKGDTAVIFGKIKNLKTEKAFRKKISMAKATIEDDTGSVQVVWFNQPYLAKMIAPDSLVRAEGKVSQKKTGELYLSNPKIETVTKLPFGVGDSLFGEPSAHTLYPVYPESRGITSNWFYHALNRIFKSGILDSLTDPVPEAIREKYHLPSLKTALIWIHAPKSNDDALSARKRFAFEEVFFIQLEKQKQRMLAGREPSFVIPVKNENMHSFLSRFPFAPTHAQEQAIETILADFKAGHPMSRLLEGDVGSGKTLVAAASAYATVTTKPNNQSFGNLQVAYMCPTEILAGQHFDSFIQYFKHPPERAKDDSSVRAGLPINIGLITSSGCKKFPSKVDPSGATEISRSQLLKWLANGEIPILIGTHSLIQKAVKFKHLALIIIDEQHRFGVNQRKALVHGKNGVSVPHLLSMTATPIPRTLALTIYGDLDLSLLDQMPLGRKPIITEVVLPTTREKMNEKIRQELEAGRQAYVICPRIDEPDPEKTLAVQAKSVKEEANRLKKTVFQEYSIGVLHGKMKPSLKEKVMKDFKAGKIHILCATSVVEVGVNVENATVIVIEGAERFGLAQLHQLRGRVIRSNHQAYCFVYAETASKKTFNRLNALTTSKNGFELAEFDLQARGPGELYGGHQWGISDVAMEALKNLKMVEAARAEARALLEKDFELQKYPEVKKHLDVRNSDKIHFE